ncbi:MAG: right-handed parallel beta-helix repeat-containing protein [Candidatus Coatesbacteria bacterium]|nr:right-handed parallel beta-helix repeat-containing protein [Candidatus Coatesbacteria bacterium]
MAIKAVLSVSIVVLVLACGASLATNYFVDANNGNDRSTGLTWDDSWKTISHALGTVSGTAEDPVTIHIAQGTYSASTNAEVFPLVAKSYLSLVGESGPDGTVLDGESKAARVIYCRGLTGLTIDGLTITGGNAKEGHADNTGAGICLEHCSDITISRCVVSENEAVLGGGVFAYLSELEVLDCEIRGNRVVGSLLSDGEAHGGGLFCTKSDLFMQGCLIEGNTAEGGPLIYMPACEGGGVHLGDSEPLCLLSSDHARGGMTSEWNVAVVKDCEFNNNVAGSIWTYGNGGGMFCHRVTLTLTRCQFTGNRAVETGGAIALGEEDWSSANYTIDESDKLIENCLITGSYADAFGGGISVRNASARISNCLLISNTSGATGGGMYLRVFDPEGDPSKAKQIVANCTIVDGFGYGGGGIDVSAYARPDITNCILWGNSGDIWSDFSATTAVTHCCIEDGYEGEGNFDADPLFTSGPLGDYYLSCVAAGQAANSPCLDAGSVASDQVGLNRKTTRTDERPDMGLLDIGYHYSIPGRWIKSLLNSSEFSPDDIIVAGLAIQNNDAPVCVDLYVAFILPDGAIMSFDGASWAFGISPWFSNLPLETGFAAGPYLFYVGYITESAPVGQYLLAAALAEPGTLSWIASSEAPFEVN